MENHLTFSLSTVGGAKVITVVSPMIVVVSFLASEVK